MRATPATGSIQVRRLGGRSVWDARAMVASVIRACLLVSLLVAALNSHRSTAYANGAASRDWTDATVVRSEAARESWSGGDGVRDVWALYSGVTWAPFTNLQQDGWRVRVVGTRSTYRYIASPYDPVLNAGRPTLFQGGMTTADVLIGWQASQGPWTWKVFGGVQWRDHRIAPVDPEAEGVGKRIGGVAALETWLNLGTWGWASLDLTYATAARTHGHRLRLASRIGEVWSVGGEVRLLGDVEAPTWRLGPFVRFDNGTFEVTVAGGLNHADGNEQGHYATAQLMRRF